jgi:hypothetical protein
MHIRTFVRTFINTVLRDNFLYKTFKNIVNFYYNICFPSRNNLSFTLKNPININEKRKNISFLSVTGDKIDCK